MSEDSIGTRFINSMKKLGVEGVEALLLYLPTKYKDYRKPISGISEAQRRGGKCYLKLKLTKRPVLENPPGGPGRAKLRFTDGAIEVSAMVFGNAMVWKDYKEGDYVHVVGVYGEYNGWPQLQNVELVPSNHQNRIVPLYKGKPKVVSPQTVGDKIAISLRENIQLSVNYICDRIGASEEQILKHAAPDFTSLAQIFYALHRPKSQDDIKRANKAVRMINAYQALMMSMNTKKKEANPKSAIVYDVDMIKSQLANLPFNLTGDQKRAVWEISKDLNCTMPMDRLVSGDVGCGKTLSYSLPAACAFLSGANVAIMMPNLLLASQVADEIRETFPDVDVTLMLGGKERPKEKLNKRTIIVGTTAILFWLEDINHEHEIDFLIIDEQQKLGVEQKNALISEHTNVLEATATAIPRTAAAVLYGDKKVSLIEQCPVDKTIETVVVGSDQKVEVFNELMGITQSGAQIAVLYPIRKYDTGQFELFIPDYFDQKSEVKYSDILAVIEENKGETLSQFQVQPNKDSNEWSAPTSGLVLKYRIKHTAQKRVVEALEGLGQFGLVLLGETSSDQEMETCKRSVESAAKHWEQHFPRQVVMIHGGLNVAQKLAAIEEAKNGDCKVIVTSSVIEIGLTMPDLRGLLILESNNYGASTLHQFRGRLARKGGHGKFFMGVDCPVHELDEDSKARLNLLVKYNKGSQIAEDDMKQRGFGDLSQNSVKQAGFMDGLFHGLKMTPQDVDYLIKQGLGSNNITHG